jgi:hypothetical protein
MSRRPEHVVREPSSARVLSSVELEAVTGADAARYYLYHGTLIVVGCTQQPSKGATPVSGPLKV